MDVLTVNGLSRIDDFCVVILDNTRSGLNFVDTLLFFTKLDLVTQVLVLKNDKFNPWSLFTGLPKIKKNTVTICKCITAQIGNLKLTFT